jgi:hypothetical protein
MKLLIDDVEIPWPRKIELFLAADGETMAPMIWEFHGGTLRIEATEKDGVALLWRGDADPFVWLGNMHPESQGLPPCRSIPNDLPEPVAVMGALGLPRECTDPKEYD